MDKIWDRKYFEVGGHRPLWRGWKKPGMTTQNRQKSNAKKEKKKDFFVGGSWLAECEDKLHEQYVYVGFSCDYRVDRFYGAK